MLKKILVISLLSFSFLYGEQITVLLSYGYAPYYYFDDNNKPLGLFIEIIEEVAKNEKIEIEYHVIKNWKQCLKAMKNKKYDAFGPLFRTFEREDYLIYLEDNIVYFEENVFVIMKDDTTIFNGDLSVMLNHKIGTISGYSYGLEFDNANYLSKIPVNNEEQLVKLFASKIRYDTIVGERVVLTKFLNKSEIKNEFKILEPPLYKAPSFIAFNRSKRNLAIKFASGLKKFKSSKDYKDILKRYQK